MIKLPVTPIPGGVIQAQALISAAQDILGIEGIDSPCDFCGQSVVLHTAQDCLAQRLRAALAPFSGGIRDAEAELEALEAQVVEE